MKQCPKCGYVEPKEVRLAMRIARDMSNVAIRDFMLESVEKMNLEHLKTMLEEMNNVIQRTTGDCRDTAVESTE